MAYFNARFRFAHYAISILLPRFRMLRNNGGRAAGARRPLLRMRKGPPKSGAVRRNRAPPSGARAACESTCGVLFDLDLGGARVMARTHAFFVPRAPLRARAAVPQTAQTRPRAARGCEAEGAQRTSGPRGGAQIGGGRGGRPARPLALVRVAAARREASSGGGAEERARALPAAMERFQRVFNQAGMGMGGAPQVDTPLVDTAEQVYISSLALLKMLKHGTRALGRRAMRARFGPARARERSCALVLRAGVVENATPHAQGSASPTVARSGVAGGADLAVASAHACARPGSFIRTLQPSVRVLVCRLHCSVASEARCCMR